MTTSMKSPIHWRSIVILTLATGLVWANIAAAFLPERTSSRAPAARGPEVPPAVIRFGGPGAFRQGQQMWGLLEVARARGFLNEAFRGTGTKFEFIGFPDVPMVGEALAGGAIDFAEQGELIAILSRGAGARTRMIMPMSRSENAYLVVPKNSPIHGIQDLRGRRIAYTRGAFIHIQTLKILADHGLSERDIVPVNLDPANSATVLASGGIDGVFVGPQLALPLRDRGIGRIVYSTHSAQTETAQIGLSARDDFLEQYPQTTQRIVNALVRAAQWARDPSNHEAVLQLWMFPIGKSLDDVREDFGPAPWTARTSPLIDPFLVSQYRNTQQIAVTTQLLRQPVDLDNWIDRRFLNNALQELGLTSLWPAFDATGRPMGSLVTASATPDGDRR